MPKGCVADVSAGHHLFPCDGGITYDVEIPAMCAGGGCGLVLDMHGFTMNATQEEAGTGMRTLGQKHGFVIVQPTAPGTPSSWDQAAHVPLVFAFVGDVVAALSIDPKRRHVMGFSQGGGMTWRMICAHADFWASAAPLSGIAGCEFTPPNAPSREVPTMMVHGHKDNIVSFTGIAVPQRDAALAFWKDGAGTKIGGDSAYTATRYLSPAGTPFELWEHDYTAGSVIIGGHCFPGGSDVGISPFQFGCQPPNGFNVGETAMAFFLAHPML
jgi:dienelactone hydrolase